MRFGVLILSMFVLASCAEWGTLTKESLISEETMERVKSEKAAFEQRKANERAARQKETFGLLASFAGNTYRGEPMGASSEAVADIQEWSWIDEEEPSLLIRHALEDGSYGGDTIVKKNSETGALTYVYTTTADFVTNGTFNLLDSRRWEAVEEVEGHAEISKVRNNGTLQNDGAFISSSEYFKNGRWVSGHAFIYRQTEETLEELLAKPKRFGWIPGR